MNERPPASQLTLDEQIAVARDRRRRMVAAVLYGGESRAATSPPGTWTPLIAGATLAVFVVLIVSVVMLVRAAFPASRPPAHPSPVVSSR